jgi:hypothetical protein
LARYNAIRKDHQASSIKQVKLLFFSPGRSIAWLQPAHSVKSEEHIFILCAWRRCRAF